MAEMKGQLSLFEGINTDESQKETLLEKKSGIKVVKAAFVGYEETYWEELFSGFDRLYGITFSSGIHFLEKVLSRFSYAEIIFGCENVMSSGIAATMAMQTISVEKIAKSSIITNFSKRMKDDSLKFFVSRDTRSHEKIFILESNDGKTRVITGSANMSASAFCGLQRENIVCFDDQNAFDYYLDIFETFRSECADFINPKLIAKVNDSREYLRDNVTETPFIQTIKEKDCILLRESSPDSEDVDIEIAANIKGLEKELKPMVPKPKKDHNNMIFTKEFFTGFAKKYGDYRKIEKAKRRRLPKLHIDYETGMVDFNGKQIDLNPPKERIQNDLDCLFIFLDGYRYFYGDTSQTQVDYYKFLNWYFASPFMPYLRKVANKNDYEVTSFPVYGIVYGRSNGGKSTFIKLLERLMCGEMIPFNSSSDFTATQIENLKRGCEGVPIYIDDLAKNQFTNHNEKIIKEDQWGIAEGFENYPSVVISTNKLPSLPQDITKRAVTCRIDACINREEGLKNSQKVNQSIKQASTSFYGAYLGKMIPLVLQMADRMKETGDDYFPDIFEVSSIVLISIMKEIVEVIPNYVRVLKHGDYFGEHITGRNAIKKIREAWETEPSQFTVNKKRNELVYSYPDQGRLYELQYIQQELPSVLNARITARSIIMDYDKAIELFGTKFKKRMFSK